ncbi:MAG: hypothetical protein V3V09_06010 [Arenicellales bacterium]
MYSIDELNTFDDEKLVQVDWKNITQLNGRLLELHAEGALNNEFLAKLPLPPILCIDQIERIDDDEIRATFTFPDDVKDWAFDKTESLEMLFQDQLDQLVGFWGCRKADGIGRALSSSACTLHQSLDFVAGKTIQFYLKKRKWVANKNEGGTAVFNGQILDANDALILETKNVIVGILAPADINALRQKFGGTLGVTPDADKPNYSALNLRIPLYDKDSIDTQTEDNNITVMNATQKINPELWPLKFHFRGDPVVPGNFGTHGMIALLKEAAKTHFGLQTPIFKSMSNKKFSGMIFEDPKQIRFELKDISKNENGEIVAAMASLFLEHDNGSAMIEDPIYTFKNLTVTESA